MSHKLSGHTTAFVCGRLRQVRMKCGGLRRPRRAALCDPGSGRWSRREVGGCEPLSACWPPRRPAAACPRCGRLSRQVHSRYRRGLTDLPAHGREVKISLAVRRFRCRTSRCRTALFAEPGFLRGHQSPCTTNLPITGPGGPGGSHVGRKAGAGVGRAAVAAGEQGYVPSERACCFALRTGTAARDRD